MVEDPSQPRGGRVHRIGLCTEDAAAMRLGRNCRGWRRTLLKESGKHRRGKGGCWREKGLIDGQICTLCLGD